MLFLADVRAYAYLSMWAYTYVCVLICTYTCVYAGSHARALVRKDSYRCKLACPYRCMHVSQDVYSCTDTYTHIHVGLARSETHFCRRRRATRTYLCMSTAKGWPGVSAQRRFWNTFLVRVSYSWVYDWRIACSHPVSVGASV